MTKKSASIELVIAGALWGFGFIATLWAMTAFTPAEVLVYRFAIAAVVGEIIYLIARGPRLCSAKEEFLRAFPAGFLLGGLMIMQTIGLKYTNATKSSFITSLYVIFVPLFNTLIFKSPSKWHNYLLAAIALSGTFMLMGGNVDHLNIGDLWTLGCAVFAAFHIIYIGKISNRVGNAFRFNNFQSLWCLLLLTPLLFFQDKVMFNVPHILPWAGILSLGIASSIVAFYLQVRTQRILSDTTASMLFLLEAPFAAFFGYLLLNERLSPFQTAGAAILLLTSATQTLWDSSSKTPETPNPQS